VAYVKGGREVRGGELLIEEGEGVVRACHAEGEEGEEREGGEVEGERCGEREDE
jgi:hypothetical protein